ncbi:MAG: aquaporin [Chloroflexi bacterium]|nr:aquaporin [Chloroflexota bacterium]
MNWTWVPETADELASTYRPLFAEMLGTLAFVFVAGSIMIVESEGAGLGLLGMALATAITYAIIVSALYPVSGGHINPAVTVAHVAARRMPPSIAILYVVAQFAGAILGALLLGLIFRDVVADAARTATLSFGDAYHGTWSAIFTGGFLEAILTFVLVLAYFGTLVDRRGNRSLGGFGVGLVLMVSMLFAFPLTGAALNVARVFGTATVANHWSDFGMYWLGLVGAVVAGLVYEHILASREDEA